MSISETIKREVYNKCNGRCAYCGNKIIISKMQIDHIIPRKHKGTDDLINKNPTCRRCNIWKNSYTLEEFRNEVGKQLVRLRRDSAPYRLALDFGLIKEFPKNIQFYFELSQTITKLKNE